MDDMRNQILSELIDKMHGRMADKMYPDDKPEAPAEEAKADEPIEAKAEAVEAPADDSEDLSDGDIDEILKTC